MTKAVKSIVDNSGMSGLIISTECHITNGLPAIIIIGYASKSVDEAKERLRASFSNCSIQMPKKRITLNLSPADIPKDSTSLDLAMAVAILAASKQISDLRLGNSIFLGELSLDGSLNPVRGIIGKILSAKNISKDLVFYIPTRNLEQAMLIPNITLKIADSLRDVYLDLSGAISIKSINTGSGSFSNRTEDSAIVDLSEIVGQPIAKRALEIAAAGHHNILLSGPPGTGKTMLAKAMCGILPDLDQSEALEVTHLHSLVSGDSDKIINSRPFRSPHHTSSTTALIGGGSNPKPGEASLAHRGVLFLDELPEFNRSCLEALRQPLEDRLVNVARVKSTASYPADFILAATKNPCPCGYYGSNKICRCSINTISSYQNRVSGPILDRIDIHIAVNEIEHGKLLDKKTTERESQKAKARIEKAYSTQRKRFGNARFNSSMSNKEIRNLGNLSLPAKELLDKATDKLGLSARAYIRTVKVARTIADLDIAENITPNHIGEALQYRQQSEL